MDSGELRAVQKNQSCAESHPLVGRRKVLLSCPGVTVAAWRPVSTLSQSVHHETGPQRDSTVRSWLRPQRGISQRWLPLYLGFFQAMHNLRLHAQSLLGPLLSLLLTSYGSELYSAYPGTAPE